MVYESFSAEETKKIAAGLSGQAEAGAVFCLDGELGAGKTTFAKGFALGLGITEYITSPTFTIMNLYSGRLPLYHFDAYRVAGEGMEDTGYEDYFYGEGVCLVEWAALVKELLPASAKWIKLSRDWEKGEDYRRIEVSE